MIILSFDTETSGLDPQKDRVVEFGAYVWDTEKDKNVLCEGVYFKIPFKMSDDVMKIHHISNETVQNEGVLFEEYADRAYKMLSRADVIVGHNIEFDINMMDAEFLRVGMRMPETQWIDTMILARRWYPSLKEIMPSKSLGKVSNFFMLPAFDAHRAFDDCKRTMEILFEICKDLDITIEQILDPDFNALGKYAISLGMDPFLATVCGYMSSSVYNGK